MEICPVCDNKDSRYFYRGSRGIYCRLCIQFQAMIQKEENSQYQIGDEEYTLDFPLTSAQTDCSIQIDQHAKTKSVLVEAVCGAGKTELVLLTIANALRNHKKVGWAIPRRQVVLELTERLQKAFSHLRVVPVCQGFTEQTDGDLLVCTTHQLFRYQNQFDLLILDEPDAYPFKDNDMLKAFAKKSCKGNTVYLTATPSNDLVQKVTQQQIAYVYLPARPHGYPLIFPKVRTGPVWILMGLLIYYLKSSSQSWLVFVPTKKMAQWGGKLFQTNFITSQTIEKERIIQDFKNKKNRILITTSILERGVTFEGVNVLVWQADHYVFDKASLVQISGRVGRSFNSPKGECIFLCYQKSIEVNRCLKMIKQANQSVFGA